MRSSSFIIRRVIVGAAVSVTAVLMLSPNILAQRLGIITPDPSDRVSAVADVIASRLPSPIKVLDHSLVETAFRSAKIEDPFNMRTAEARAAGTAIGCEFLLLLRTKTLRRTSLSRPEYFESFVVVYLVNARTGDLAFWRLENFESQDRSAADREIEAASPGIADRLASEIATQRQKQLKYEAPPLMDEVPAEGSPAALNLRPPIPYKRIRPIYTPQAFLYEVRASVEIEVDVAADGKIAATRFPRWAGFGLDESVESAVRSMQWRPAERNGKALPMRVLLRYNFTKVDKDL